MTEDKYDRPVTTHAEAVSRLYAHLEAGTLTRQESEYGRDAEGRRTACLLPAMIPDYYDHGSIFSCPPEVMPRWLANLTPWMSDSGSLSAWLPMVRRYAGIAARWNVLATEDWVLLDYRCRAIVLREAMQITEGDTVLELLRRVTEHLDRGDVPPGLWGDVEDAVETAAVTATEFAEAGEAQISEFREVHRDDYNRSWRRWDSLPKDSPARQKWLAWMVKSQALEVTALCVQVAEEARWSARLAAEATMTAVTAVLLPTWVDDSTDPAETMEPAADRITSAVLDAIEEAIEHANKKDV